MLLHSTGWNEDLKSKQIEAMRDKILRSITLAKVVSERNMLESAVLHSLDVQI
jgi:hypothetical protein